jgi:hypothetical protein
MALGRLGVLTAIAAALTVLSPPAMALETVPTTTALVVQGGGLYGDELVLTATVASDAGVPTGSVRFLDNNQPMGDPVPLDDTGAAVHTSPAVVGLHSYRAEFVGTGEYADSSASAFHVTIASGLVIRPEPTILAPGLRPTLTMSAHAEDVRGRPVAGEALTFKVFGRMPNPFDTGGGQVVCTAITDERGFATCGPRGLVGSVLSLLAARSYVSHLSTPEYGFSAAVAPVIRLG